MEEASRSELTVQRRAELPEELHEAVIVWSPDDGRIVFWSRGAEQLYGYAAHQACGAAIGTLLQSPDPSESLGPELQRHGHWSGELLHVRRDGRQIRVDSRLQLVCESDGRRLVIATDRGLPEPAPAHTALAEWLELDPSGRVSTAIGWRRAERSDPAVAQRMRRQLLEQLLDQLLAFAAVLAPDGTLVDVDRAALEHAGLGPGDLVHRKFWDCPWWSGDERVQHLLRDAVSRAAAGEAVRFDAEMRGAGAARRVIDLRIAPLRGDGSATELIASAVDITERKAGEARLAASAAQVARQLHEIEGIYQAAPVGLCQLDTELRFVRVNERLAEIDGLPAAAHIGRTVREIVPNLAEVAEPLLRRALETGEAVRNIELSGETPGAPGVRRHWIESWMPLRDASGAVVGLDIAIDEITERKRLEELLRSTEHRQRFLAEATKLLTASLDPQHALHALARLAVPILGDFCVFDIRSEDGCFRRAGWAHVDPAKGPAFEQLLQVTPGAIGRGHPIRAAVESGEAQLESHVTDEWLQQVADGPQQLELMRTLRIHSVLTVPLTFGDRRLGALTFGFEAANRRHDASDLELAQELAQRAAIAVFNASLYHQSLERERALRESDRRKDDFLAVLAHELRGPLAPLRNGLHVLRLTAPQDEAILRSVAMMERQLAQMVRLIDDLLDVGRFSRGKLTIERSQVVLGAAIESALETTRPLIEAAGHELHLSLPAEPILVEGDFTRLAQVFSNLVSNSVKYTDRGGRIDVKVERSGSGVAVSVRDTGMGIPAESLSRVFEMFAQVEQHKGRAAGLGIGLALVRALVELHGGTVGASSAGLGHGSTFTVWLPTAVADRAAARDAAAAADVPRTDSPLKVLVVDDQADSADSLASLLTLMGHEAHKAYDGGEAIRLFQAIRPEVVFMDIGMPEMDGLQATRRIRSLPGGERVTVVAVTGWGQQADRVRSRAAGIDLHLVKPVALETLHATLVRARRPL